MFFWIKKKDVVLDCFTWSYVAYEFAKPDFSYKFFPEWFIKLPKFYPEDFGKTIKNVSVGTIKNCKAFTRYHTANSIVVPWHCDISIKPTDSDEKKFEYSHVGLSDKPLDHNRLQFQGMLNDNYQQLKIEIPWAIRSNKFVEFVWSDPVWNRQNILDYCVLPGVVDFKYNHGVAVNIIFQYKSEPHSFELNLGEPAISLIPINECNIKIKHHLIEQKDFGRYSKPLGYYLQKPYYKIIKRLTDAADHRENMTKCPFGFGK